MGRVGERIRHAAFVAHQYTCYMLILAHGVDLWHTPVTLPVDALLFVTGSQFLVLLNSRLVSCTEHHQFTPSCSCPHPPASQASAA